MGYTIGSGKDARRDRGFTEQDFLARFVARQPEIVAYKRQHGGDYEGAYQAVTGEPWPEGRSVKVHGDGRAEMTKDRTVKSVLGKYVALPAAYAGATLATGGSASPLLFGIGGGAGAASGAGATALGGAASVTPGLIGGGVATGSTMGTLGSILGSNAGLTAVNQGVGALSGYFANRSASRSNDRAAELEAEAASASLAFLKEQEATRRSEWQATQEKNYKLYREQQERLAPYRQMGQASLGQLGRPIPKGSGRTLAELLR